MENSNTSNQGMNDEFWEVKDLWTAMAGLENKFEHQIDEVSRDLCRSFLRTFNWLTAQMNDIQHSIQQKGKEVHQDILPPLPINPTQFTRNYAYNRVNQGFGFDGGTTGWPNRELDSERIWLNQQSNKYRHYRLNLDLPNFSGHSHMKEFLDWLTTIDKFFEYIEMPESKQVKVGW